ncbi:hypothetical protein [Pedobacter mucosus]|uniref:hypothetical protein n=1 Tax=Pedobacter mucosus TaxID=2895286 RepID=UPI001EE4AAF8|nr:hypothetical protein [Pedobacter mucosus]UKT65879.1 hypothetical protein LOK61_08820 [Pedobacter mucosus]
MNYPHYIFYELLIRLAEIEPEIGYYISNTTSNGICILRTNTGTLVVPDSLLIKQSTDPNQIAKDDLYNLLKNFEQNYL